MAEVTIEQLKDSSAEAAQQLGELLTQLTPRAQKLDETTLQRIAELSALYVARVDGKIVGTVCRVDLHHLVRTKSWIEDLVVDETQRGQGIAKRLMEAAIAGAPDDVVSVNLNSSIHRVDSHRLYLALGFEQREDTRIWRLPIER